VAEKRKQCLLAKDLHERLLLAFGDLSQDKIAEEADIDRGTVSKILKNEAGKFFHLKKVEKVLLAFHVEFNGAEILDALPNNLFISTSSIVSKSPFVGIAAEKLLSSLAGRDELLRQIFEELNKGCSRSLLGDALVGKTWLLKEICSLGSQRTTSGINDFFYLDLRMVNPGQFFPTLCKFFGVDPPQRGIDLQTALRGKKYVLCLDEIDRLANDACFDRMDRDQLCGICTGADLKG
jgi:transcriptional regulator with XRE-family HTH domain